ncbi:hypothetical protein [Citricoccus sp. GCM10030269]|uniref:hypothetical protein n=1 Tax=Citricoccus sp. GCM10030269 TaxID=3273388 RepID=UPI00360BB3E7
MSTYLSVVLPDHLEDRFAAWLGETAKADHLVIDLPSAGYRWHHVARAAQEDVVTQESPRLHHPEQGGASPGMVLPEAGVTLFRGFAQDPEATTLVFAASGLSALRHTDPHLGVSEWDGCHLLIDVDHRGFRATTDFFRQLPLLYTSGQGLVAMSDSWSLLVDLRSALGLPLTVDTSAALASSWPNAMANHPLSATTLCHEIRMLPPGARLEVLFHSTTVSEPRPHQTPWPELFAPPGTSWGTEVRRAAVRTASLASAWAATEGTSVRLALSGGVDSRLVLAATLMADPDSDVTVYNTTNLGKANQADADVVASLSERFGFPVGAGGRPAPRPVLEKYASPLSVWLLGSLGLNHQLALPSFRVGGNGFFTVSGHGAGVHKGAFGWRSIPDLKAEIAANDPAMGTAVARESAAILRQLGLDPEDRPHATEWHYVAIRNSIHGGRFAVQNMLGPRPLMQRQLVSLAHAPAGSPASAPPEIGPVWTRGGGSTLTAALASVLSPELAAHRYDSPAKAIAPETIQAVLVAAGGPLDPSERHAVRTFGAPADVVNGPPAVFETMARGRLDAGLSHTPEGSPQKVHQQVTALLEDGFRVAQDLGFSEWFTPTAERARAALAAGGPLSHARGDAGTLMTFLPLARAGLTEPVPSRAVPNPQENDAGPSTLRRLAGRGKRWARRRWAR